MMFWLVALFTLVTGLGVAGALTWTAFQDLKRAKLVRETPQRPVRDLVAGLHEVTGNVRAQGKLLESPLTQRPCVFFRFQVQQRRTESLVVNGRPAMRSGWVTVVDEKQAIACVVDDGSGSVSVDLWSAQMELRSTVHADSGFLRDAPPELETLLRERYGRTTRGILFNKPFRYTETILKDEARVYVLGQVSEQTAGAWRFTRTPDEVLVVSDRGPDEVEAVFRRRGLFRAGGAALTALATVCLTAIIIAG